MSEDEESVWIRLSKLNEEDESASWGWTAESSFEAFLIFLVFLGLLIGIAKSVKNRCGSPPPQARDVESGGENARIHQFWKF